jgi:pantothenate kinase
VDPAGRPTRRWEVDGIGSGSCPMAGIGIYGAEPGCAIATYYHIQKYFQITVLYLNEIHMLCKSQVLMYYVPLPPATTFIKTCHIVSNIKQPGCETQHRYYAFMVRNLCKQLIYRQKVQPGKPVS